MNRSGVPIPIDQGFAATPGAAQTFIYREGRVTEAVNAVAISYAPSFKCTGAGTSQAAADRIIAAFEKEYPAALVDPARVEGVAVEPAVLARIVGDLACLASLPGGDPFVADQASALFASPRHGAAAFAALDRLASAGDSAAARFARQMRAYARPRGSMG